MQKMENQLDLRVLEPPGPETKVQASWKSLRAEFPSLSPAQMHHILREYDPRRPCPSAWTPSSDEADAAHRTTDILESFDDHPPLVLPVDGFVLDLKRSIGDTSLIKQLSQLREFIKTFTEKDADTPKARRSQYDSAVPLEAKRTKMEVPPKAHLEPGHAQVVLPQTCDSAKHSVTADLSISESLLTQKLKALELLSQEANPSDGAEHLEHLCLLTPPNTPLCSDLMDSEDQADRRCGTTKREEGGCEQDRTGNDDVFVVELQKGPEGLGLALVDGVETPLKTSGIYIKSVIPGSPAALSQRLRPGDRLLAVNGLRLIGLDYDVGRELIQKAGDRAQLLVGRTLNKDAIPQR